jgi:RNA polymerase sigma-70 factor, ECF subfamily
VVRNEEAFADVLVAAQRGEEWAVGVLWRRFQPPLLRYLRGVCGEFAEDAASETWLSVGDALPRFRGDEQGFRAWLFTLGRRRAIDHARRAARHAMPVDRIPEGPGEDAVHDELARSEALAVTLSYLSALPLEQREVVLLRTVGGFDVDEVASIMDKRAGTVRVIHHRALKHLAKAVARGVTQEGGDPISHDEDLFAA